MHMDHSQYLYILSIKMMVLREIDTPYTCLAVGERPPPRGICMEEETLAFNRPENLSNPDSADPIARHPPRLVVVGPHRSHSRPPL